MSLTSVTTTNILYIGKSKGKGKGKGKGKVQPRTDREGTEGE
jgi:hypothetical protein